MFLFEGFLCVIRNLNFSCIFVSRLIPYDIDSGNDTSIKLQSRSLRTLFTAAKIDLVQLRY